MRVPVLLLIVSCAGSGRFERRLDTLENEHDKQVQRLEQINQEIAEAEARAARARQLAEFENCRAGTARLDATIAAQRSQCIERVASFNVCTAQNSERRAKGTATGCGVGIVLSIITGGAAAPLALGGCAVGYGVGDASSENCRAPACTESFDDIERLVYVEEGLDARPRCGGYLGVDVVAATGTADGGVPVLAVGPGTTAHLMGLTDSDVIIRMNDQPILATGDIRSILSELQLEAPITLEFVRGRQRWKVRGPAKNVDFYGKVDPKQLWLGVKLDDAINDISYDDGAEVAHVVRGSPAATAGLVAGDRVQQVAGEDVRTVRDVEKVLGNLPPGTVATFAIARGGEESTVSVALQPRGDHNEL